MQQPVEARIGEAFHRPFLALTPDRVDHLEALSPALEELRDYFRRILQVAIHHHDRATARVVESRRERDLVTEVAGEVDDLEPRVGGVELAKGGEAVVGAAVVDEQHLVVGRVPESVAEPLAEDRGQVLKEHIADSGFCIHNATEVFVWNFQNRHLILG